MRAWKRVRIDGVDWIFKDFASRAFSCATAVGRFLLGREVRALRRLQGIDGIPSDGLPRRWLRDGGALRARARAGPGGDGRRAGQHRVPAGAGSAAAAGACARPGAPGHARRRQPADDARTVRPASSISRPRCPRAGCRARCATGSRPWTWAACTRSGSAGSPTRWASSGANSFERLNQWRRLVVPARLLRLSKKRPPRPGRQ